MKKRVLIAHPYVYASGGGNAVAAWAIEALSHEFDLTLATLGPVDYEAVNRSFGTSLRQDEFTVEVAPASYRRLIKALPTPGALLECCLTMRWAQQLDRRRRFDVLFSTQNEADFGRRGLQYVHYPWVYLPRPEIEMRWFHRIPGMLDSYRSFCGAVAKCSNEGLRRNVSLANSTFVAGKIREVHGMDSQLVYPPVPGEFPEIPWEERRAGMIGVGRMNGCKRWEMAVGIVDEVRRRGHDLTLTLISHVDDLEYGARIASLAATRPWFRILQNLSRQELSAELARHRYGIHTMENEHFGIAPAELLRAGCIPFVHRSGGPVEIVAHRDLTFDDVSDAAEKITQVLRSPVRERELRAHVASRRDVFTTERFCGTLREIVGSFSG
jgi:glycosyltransferase involved in cell wall biosynthesis